MCAAKGNKPHRERGGSRLARPKQFVNPPRHRYPKPQSFFFSFLKNREAGAGSLLELVGSLLLSGGEVGDWQGSPSSDRGLG